MAGKQLAKILSCKGYFIWMGTTPRVNIMEPNLIKEILFQNDAFQKPKLNPLGQLLQTGLLGREGEKWAKHRTLLNPAFRLEKLKNMREMREITTKTLTSSSLQPLPASQDEVFWLPSKTRKYTLNGKALNHQITEQLQKQEQGQRREQLFQKYLES
ncbi:unnamed protein product [Camellia sinensis]